MVHVISKNLRFKNLLHIVLVFQEEDWDLINLKKTMPPEKKPTLLKAYLPKPMVTLDLRAHAFGWIPQSNWFISSYLAGFLPQETIPNFED